MFSSWMSASLHVRPVSSSSPTFKFLPCIASMIKKQKRKQNCRIRSKSCVPTVKFARWKTGSKATILKQVTQKWRVSDAFIILAWWPEKIVFIFMDRVGDCWSYFIPFEFYTYWKTDLKGNYYHCIAIITYRFFSLRLSEVRFVGRFIIFVSLQRLVVVLKLNSAEALL